MAIVGTILQEVVRRRPQLAVIKREPIVNQKKTFRKLLEKASGTSFGKAYKFEDLLANKNSIEKFQAKVPIHDYNLMHDRWWFRCLLGEENVCWPGLVKHFALSSGTSGAPSKYIPVSKQMIRSIRKASLRQILSLSE